MVYVVAMCGVAMCGASIIWFGIVSLPGDLAYRAGAERERRNAVERSLKHPLGPS